MVALALLVLILLLRVHSASQCGGEEKYLSNIRQLTFGGVNSRPRFSEDGSSVVFQASGSIPYGSNCEQAYRLRVGENRRQQPSPSSAWKGISRLGPGVGTATAPSPLPKTEEDWILSSDFHRVVPKLNSTSIDEWRCENDSWFDGIHSARLNPNMDLFRINKWANFKRKLTSNDAFDGDASVSPDGRLAVFTSTRGGDPDLWLMNAEDGSSVRRLIRRPGFEGGATFSANGARVVFHAIMPESAEEQIELNSELRSEIFVVSVDGSGLRQITKLNASSWDPAYLRDGTNRLIFSTSFNSSSTANGVDGGDLYVIGEHGEGLQRITCNGRHEPRWMNAFPSFDSGGKRLVWAATRGATRQGDVNLFMADWNSTDTNIDVADINRTRPYRRTTIDRRRSKTMSRRSGRRKKSNALHYKGEKHLTAVRQLTFGGQNAEGYFAFNDHSIVMQAASAQLYGTECDQIYRLPLHPAADGVTRVLHPLHRLSTGLGACTCSYLFPDNNTPFMPAHFCNTSYTWDLFPTYDIFKVNEYGNFVARLTATEGYDAEGAISPDGSKIVFTSVRSGDPELWLMDSDGGNLKQLTNELGYDGGPFFSPDGSKISFRASRPRSESAVARYKQLLSYNLVEPLAMELFTVNIDGRGLRQVARLGGSNWAPFYLADNKRIVFSSNFNATGRGHFGAFDLYVVNEDGGGLERVTFNEGGFDAFPMMSRNGKRLVWGSSRNGRTPTELNLFLAAWRS